MDKQFRAELIKRLRYCCIKARPYRQTHCLVVHSQFLNTAHSRYLDLCVSYSSQDIHD